MVFTSMRIALIGSVGFPNRYGGFESFVEQCAPELANLGNQVVVTCDASVYKDNNIKNLNSVERVFINVPANGALSVIHDLISFLAIFSRADCIIVLGVSAGPFFPLFRILCSLLNKQLIVNVDGVEWRRRKFSYTKRIVLRIFDALAQLSSHSVVYDNLALEPYILRLVKRKSSLIPYSGDHAIRLNDSKIAPSTALTICRIEPENNVDLLLRAAVNSSLKLYTVIGNWNSSNYGRELRKRYQNFSNILLLDPIYDPVSIAKYRENCAIYLHGHSVGGTNPSLVEMIFYDCLIICFDCVFNRATSASGAVYFKDENELVQLIDSSDGYLSTLKFRDELRKWYTRKSIANSYLNILNK